jgi:hypothetical protein
MVLVLILQIPDYCVPWVKMSETSPNEYRICYHHYPLNRGTFDHFVYYSRFIF